MSYNYFVSYSVDVFFSCNNVDRSMGRCVITRDELIRRIEDIEGIEEGLEKQYATEAKVEHVDVVIINFKLFDGE